MTPQHKRKIAAALTVHGESRTGSSEYWTWLQMRQRCARKTHIRFKYYGGRGIRVCKRWDSFAAFLADMGAGPRA